MRTRLIRHRPSLLGKFGFPAAASKLPGIRGQGTELTKKCLPRRLKASREVQGTPSARLEKSETELDLMGISKSTVPISLLFSADMNSWGGNREKLFSFNRLGCSVRAHAVPRAIGDSPECLSFHSGFALHPVDYLRAKDDFEIASTPVG
jgi:hypothetical protein